MKKVNDKKLLNHYLKTNKISSLFSNNYNDSFELFYFQKNEFIIQQGYESKYLFILVDGTARFICLTESGALIPFGIASDLVVFGEIASLHQQDPDASVQAISEVYCLGLSLEANREKILNDNKFLRYVIDILSEKVQSLDRSITAFLSATITERLASYLLQVNNNGKLNVTVKNCADSIGGSYRHTNRVFSIFVEEGALKKINGKYFIVNSDILLKHCKQNNFNI